ncbi:MAG TPA: phosphoribosylformylglycinamidine cyclo-ligase [Longimicrobiales bacterium]|nr:phosphoribosylformylglycinamidine cyclo-ligase [Longimicrobiales bacterium]
MTQPTTYREAGVDRDAARDAKNRILDLVKSTATGHVVSNAGGFGGLVRVPDDLKSPLLVSSADGVGTKLKVAMMSGRHNTIGHDLVNHCVNDILVEGARPLFFLDYIGMGALEPGIAEQIVAGVAAGCIENGCALVGGETAEMPDFYAPGEYDLAGFIVGTVGEANRLGAHRVAKGDVLLGLSANGFHTNGYSLVRKVLFDKLKLTVDDVFPDSSSSVADILLRVHRSYLPSIQQVALNESLHALAHITGGGIPENLDRVIPAGLCARVERKAWTVPFEFQAIQKAGQVPQDDMDRTFNNGIGMVAIVAKDEAEAIARQLREAGEEVFTIGEVVAGDEPVVMSTK